MNSEVVCNDSRRKDGEPVEKVLILAGPTGVGKTKLSIELAKAFHGEIISGDSMQVYRGMSIGTAKVTPEEAQGVAHVLVDCFDFDEEYNVMLFQKYGREAIREMTARKVLPIVVGGTGLYLKSLYYDYEFQEEVIDEDFLRFLKERSHDEIVRMLEAVDPQAFETIHRNNRKRMERALMRAHLGEKKSVTEGRQKHEPIYDALVIGLTCPREELYLRIDLRVDRMLEAGLEPEIRALIAGRDESVWSLQSMQGIGYKEWKEYFLGNQTLTETAELIKKNSRNFAKRQYTWFNNQMQVNWYDINDADWHERVMADVQSWLERE